MLLDRLKMCSKIPTQGLLTCHRWQLPALHGVAATVGNTCLLHSHSWLLRPCWQNPY